MLFDTWLLGWDSESKVGDESQLHSSPFSLPSKDNEMPAGIWAEVLSSQAQRWPGSSSGGTGCVSEMLRAGSSRGCLLRRGTSGFPLAVADSMVSPGSHKASELLLCLILWWVVPTHREQPFFWCQVADEHLPVSSTRCCRTSWAARFTLRAVRHQRSRLCRGKAPLISAIGKELGRAGEPNPPARSQIALVGV